MKPFSEYLDAWLSLRKSAATFDGDVASSERPDQVLARANAFLSRLEDTARRVETFESSLAGIDLQHGSEGLSAEACVKLADALEDNQWLAPLDDELGAIFGRQTLPRIQHYNHRVNDCKKTLARVTQELRVYSGQMSARLIKLP
jgi:hypothetical protein